MKLQKRGQEETGSTLLGLLIVLALLIIFFLAFSIIFGDIFGDFGEQSSAKSYANIINISKNLENSPEQFLTKNLILSIHEDATIVGFNKNENYAKEVCGALTEEIQKPATCGKDACLCYYDPGYDEDFNEDNKLSSTETCVRLPKIDYIMSFYYAESKTDEKKVKDYYGVSEEVYDNIYGDRIYPTLPPYYPSEKYSYLFLYGECDDSYWDAEFGKQLMYIEKVNDPVLDKTYLLIVKDVEKQYLESRAEMFEKNTKKPPEYYLNLITEAFNKKDYKKTREYASVFQYYYSGHSKISEVENYLQQITKTEEEQQKEFAEVQKTVESPPGSGYPPAYT